jgi:Anti-sigma-D factor RsdA to sigma factor binding region
MPDFGRWTNGGDPSLNEINRTDRFLDALANQQPVYSTDPSEAELAQLMAGWRDEIRTPPLMSPVTPRDAVVAFDNARASRRRSRMTLALVGSTAAAVLCLGGFVSVVAGAGPGDTLYGLRTMIFGEQQATRDDAVVLAAQTQMAEVQQLIDQGQWDAAQAKLETLTTTVATVDDVERKEELVSEWQQLTVKVEAQDPAATIPPNVPPPVFPDVPAVVLDTTTSTSPSDTTTSSETTTSTSPSETTTTTSPSETTTTSPSETTTTSAPTSPPVQGPPPTSIPATTPSPDPRTLLTTPPPVTQTPLPTPEPSTPLPTPEPETPLPTPTVATPLPTPSTSGAVEQESQEAPTSEEPPILQVTPPESVVTTTVVIPEPGDNSGDEPS